MSRRVLIDGGPLRGRRGLARYAKELAYGLSRADTADLDIDMLVPEGEAATALAAALGPGLRLLPRPDRGVLAWQLTIRAAARRGYDLVHGLDNGLPPGLGRRLRGVATVHDVSFLDPALQTTARNRLGNAWRAARFTALARSGAPAIADSACTAATARARGVRVVQVTPPPIALFLSTPPTRPPDLPDAPFLLIAGGASGYKRVDFALEAIQPLAAQAGLRRVAFGGRAGSEPGGVTRLGALSDAQVRFLYAQARLTVFPSVREGFGLPVVESLGCGTPVVAAELAPMTELRLPGVGFFRADDAADLRRAATAALADGGVAARQGPAAVAAFYRQAPCVADLYRSL